MPTGRLKWQCRRGCRELDRLLESYLENSYATSDPQEQRLFAALLEQEDDYLLALLMGGLAADLESMARLVQKINHADNRQSQHGAIQTLCK